MVCEYKILRITALKEDTNDQVAAFEMWRYKKIWKCCEQEEYRMIFTIDTSPRTYEEKT